MADPLPSSFARKLSADKHPLIGLMSAVSADRVTCPKNGPPKIAQQRRNTFTPSVGSSTKALPVGDHRCRYFSLIGAHRTRDEPTIVVACPTVSTDRRGQTKGRPADSCASPDRFRPSAAE